MYKLCFYVPEKHTEAVKSAVFSAGAGVIGDYEKCSWQVLGQGQFQPAKGSEPYMGELGRLEAVLEHKVEMVCNDEVLMAVITALKASHPYEEPSYQYWRVNKKMKRAR